jgi:hypothetical protein
MIVLEFIGVPHVSLVLTGRRLIDTSRAFHHLPSSSSNSTDFASSSGMGDRSVPSEDAPSGAGNPEEPDNLTNQEPRIVQNFYGSVNNIQHLENANNGHNYGELSFKSRIIHRR